MTDQKSEEHPRFERITAQSAGGTKIAARREVNQALTVDEAFDEGHFRELLEKAFGPVDEFDDHFEIDVIDHKTGMRFKAYCGPSGPAYGGAPTYYERTEQGSFRLKADVRKMLEDFERWLSRSEEQ